MKRETQNILLILLGGALVKIAVNGDYLRYVKPAQQPWIITGGAVMVLLGVVAIVRDLVAARASASHGTTAIRIRRVRRGCCWCRCWRCSWSPRRHWAPTR